MNKRNFWKSCGAAIAALGLGCGVMLIAGCDGRVKEGKTNEDQEMMTENKTKTLVAYFSRSGNTRRVAQVIQKSSGADLVEIKVVNPYPTEYRATTAQARKEIDAGFKPEIVLPLENLDKYDTIFVGTPNWWSTMAPPVATFLTQFDFTGKTIVPFVTHGGGGVARCVSDMKKLVPNATFLNELTLRDSGIEQTDEQVEIWVRSTLSLQ